MVYVDALPRVIYKRTLNTKYEAKWQLSHAFSPSDLKSLGLKTVSNSRSYRCQEESKVHIFLSPEFIIQDLLNYVLQLTPTISIVIM